MKKKSVHKSFKETEINHLTISESFYYQSDNRLACHIDLNTTQRKDWNKGQGIATLFKGRLEFFRKKVTIKGTVLYTSHFAAGRLTFHCVISSNFEAKISNWMETETAKSFIVKSKESKHKYKCKHAQWTILVKSNQ